MLRSTVKYMFEYLEKSEDLYFTVSDRREGVVLDYDKEDTTSEETIAELESFLESNTGYFIIEIRETRGRTGKGNKTKFGISNGSEKESSGSSSVFGKTKDSGGGFMEKLFLRMIDGSMAGKEKSDQEVTILRKEVSELKTTIKDKEIDAKFKEYDKKLAESANGSAMTGVAIKEAIRIGTAAFSSTSVQPVISGHGDPEVEVEVVDVDLPQEDSDELDAIIKGLLKIDPNFVKNIGKLYALAKARPDAYQNAVNMLGNMI